METISQGLPKLGKINLKPLSSKGVTKILKILDKKKLRKSLFYELGKYFESNIMYNNVVLAGLSLKSFSQGLPKLGNAFGTKYISN
jgi:hypothetical protein